MPDPTVEGLAKAWVSAPASLGIFTAEGGQFVGGHGMSLDQRLKTAATYSNIWDGQSIKRVRAGDGVTILTGRRLSMHLMIQPDAAMLFLSDPLLRDQGLLSRMLVSAPDSIAGSRQYREPSAEDDAVIRTYGARLLSILEAPWPLDAGKNNNELNPPVLVMSDDAVTVWRAFYDHVERQSGPSERSCRLRDFASKAAEHAARIAGVLTVVANLHAASIAAEEMQAAVALMDWYVNEALRLQSGRADIRLVRAQQLLDWLIGRCQRDSAPTPIPFRDILRFGPNPLRTKEEADKAVAVLVEHEWIEDRREQPAVDLPSREARHDLPALQAFGTWVPPLRQLRQLRQNCHPETPTVANVATVAGVEARNTTFEERAAIVEHDGGAPREWAEGFARLDAATPPKGFDLGRWRQLIDDGGRFLDRWALTAAECGWSATDVFGLHPVASGRPI